jgi:hypothetical protein
MGGRQTTDYRPQTTDYRLQTSDQMEGMLNRRKPRSRRECGKSLLKAAGIGVWIQYLRFGSADFGGAGLYSWLSLLPSV